MDTITQVVASFTGKLAGGSLPVAKTANARVIGVPPLQATAMDEPVFVDALAYIDTEVRGVHALVLTTRQARLTSTAAQIADPAMRSRVDALVEEVRY